jgi:hypothetical protein
MPAGATYEPIATTTVSGTTNAINFNSIPSTYTDLRLVLFATSNANINAYMTFNSDSAANYSVTYLMGDGTSASSSRLSSQYDIKLTTSTAINNGSVNLFTVDIFSYAGSTNKTALKVQSSDRNGAGAVDRAVILWRNTAALTSIQISSGSSLTTGTTATLYGIKAA